MSESVPAHTNRAERTIRVVAAVLERDGRYLITQRRPTAVLPLLWEFPGGKVEPGETDSQALKREHVRDSGTHTVCGWKGTASYFDLVVDGKVNKDAVWYYPEPKDAAKMVEFANVLTKSIAHKLAYIHMPVPIERNNGRAKNTRNSTPPSAIDCARMVSPWTTIDR